VDCSGDHNSGLRYFVLPGALPEALPMGAERATWYDALDRFNRPISLCDQADHVTMMFRSRFPCDPTCKNMDFLGGPEHGNGDIGGSASWVSVSLNSAGTDGLATMGLILSQELGSQLSSGGSL